MTYTQLLLLGYTCSPLRQELQQRYERVVAELECIRAEVEAIKTFGEGV